MTLVLEKTKSVTLGSILQLSGSACKRMFWPIILIFTNIFQKHTVDVKHMV